MNIIERLYVKNHEAVGRAPMMGTGMGGVFLMDMILSKIVNPEKVEKIRQEQKNASSKNRVL